MTSRIFLQWTLLTVLCTILPVSAGGLPATEKTNIEALLAHVAGMKDAKFVRNGKEYDAKSAAKFLRGKWEANDTKILSAEDFIAVAATRSNTTGKPYLIRLEGGATKPCADYLKGQLAAIRAK